MMVATEIDEPISQIPRALRERHAGGAREGSDAADADGPPAERIGGWRVVHGAKLASGRQLDDDDRGELMVRCLDLVRRRRVLVGFGLVAIATYNLVPAAILQSVVYEGLGTIAAVSVAVRARRYQGRARVGFALVGIGIGCWVGGDVASDVMRFTSGDAPIPYPSVADLMYLLGYGIALGGAAILARDVFGRPALVPLIDGAIAAATFLVVAWAAVIVGGISAGSTADTLGVLSYPTLDVLALAAGVRWTCLGSTESVVGS